MASRSESRGLGEEEGAEAFTKQNTYTNSGKVIITFNGAVM